MTNPPKVFGSLMAEIIKTDLCMYCGTCIASCPVNVLHFTEDEKPAIKGICVLCELCYYSCPRVELPLNEYEEEVFGRSRTSKEPLGVIRNTFLARSTDNEILKVAQDGGVVSTLLIYALQNHIIDLAAVTGGDSDFSLRPKPFLASDKETVLSAAGSRYSPGGSVALLADAAQGYPHARIAFVGLPCQIQGVKRLTFSPKGNRKLGDNTIFTIGIYCMNAFHYKEMMEYLRDQMDINPDLVEKMDITKGKLKVYLKGEKDSKDVPIKELYGNRIGGCYKCQDFTGELADISVGAVDTSSGWSVVITRSEIGDNLIKEACTKGLLECKPVKNIKKNLAQSIKLSETKRKREAPYIKHSLQIQA